jgi:protein-tyrosine phosphatase
MVDIHCHILPAFDDGVRTMDEASFLIQTEVSGGTKTFVATPHVIDKRDFDRLDELPGRIDALREALSRDGVKADIVQGGEIYPTSAMLTAFDAGRPVTVAGLGRHMLVDLPLTALPHDFESLLYELQVRGVTPILAHPERVATFQREPDLLLDHLENGIVCQVNAGSLSGRYGPRAKEVANYILRRRWANFLASDAHRPPRKPILGECVKLLRPELGVDYVEFLTVTCPTCLLTGADLPPRPTPPPVSRSLLSRLFGRKRA